VRVAPRITLSDEDRQVLQRWARGRSTPARLVLRARIVLAAAEGKENKSIAAELNTNRPLVGKWRTRFAQRGLAGIEKDAPRGGRPSTARDAMAAKIIEWTTQKKPANATQWSCRTLAVVEGLPPQYSLLPPRGLRRGIRPILYRLPGGRQVLVWPAAQEAVA
jgi:transposase